MFGNMPEITRNNATANSFFTFETLVSSGLVKFVYAFGAVLMTGIGVIMLFSSESWPGIVLLLLGNLGWRLLCEVSIVIFGIHDQLIGVRRELEKLNQSVTKS